MSDKAGAVRTLRGNEPAMRPCGALALAWAGVQVRDWEGAGGAVF